MIEVNLLPGKKIFKLPVLMGVDLNLINVKLIALAILFDFLRPLYESTWEEDLAEIQQRIDNAQRELNAEKRKGKGLESIKDQIDKASTQEAKLNDKLEVVKRIIKIKKNPTKILVYISQYVPDDLWVNTINIEGDHLIIEGESHSYPSIGKFIESLKNSIFFKDKNVVLEDSRTMSDEATKKRSEYFKISATIERYD